MFQMTHPTLRSSTFMVDPWVGRTLMSDDRLDGDELI